MSIAIPSQGRNPLSSRDAQPIKGIRYLARPSGDSGPIRAVNVPLDTSRDNFGLAVITVCMVNQTMQ